MKRLLTLLLLAATLLSLFCFGANAKVYEGRALDENYILGDSYGEDQGPMPDAGMDSNDEETYALAPAYHIRYSLDTETKTLRVYPNPSYGPQYMLSYVRTSWIPWQKALYKKDIQTAVFEEGMLSVGRYSFFRSNNLKTVYLPHSLRKVDRVVFYQCPKLETIFYAGNKTDFQNNVTWIDSYNFYTDKNGVEHKALDKIHFGESVKVRCVNQEGETVYQYSVGGYFVGDEYTITPPTLDGMTFLGSGDRLTGKFKRNDKTEIVLEYTCNHEYEVKDETKPCGKSCRWCGKLDPSVTTHQWDVLVLSEQSFTEDRVELHSCRVCKNTEMITQGRAYFWYLLYGLGGAVALLVVLLPIALAVRRARARKR